MSQRIVPFHLGQTILLHYVMMMMKEEEEEMEGWVGLGWEI